MKRISGLLLLTLSLVSFAILAPGDYTISGTAAGIQNGNKVTIQLQDPVKGIVLIDSAKVVDGKFSFKGNTPEPGIHFLEVQGIQDKVAFVLEEGKINFTIYKDSVGKSKIGGTKSNDDLYGFNRSAMKIQQKMQVFKEANVQKFTEAQTKSDTVTINQLIKELNLMNNELINLSAGFPEKNPKSYLSVLFIDNMFNAPDADIKKITKNYNNLDQSLKNTKLGKALKSRIDTFVSIAIGNDAPDFSAPNPEGKTVSLKQSLGKVTIIDFWASWCGPCRKENPNVVALYNEFHDKGLNIIGVSLDRDAAKWKEAIAKDGLMWTHISNLKFWQDPIAVMYGIKSIPATLILDEKGTIIARDLRGAELRNKVASILGN